MTVMVPIALALVAAAGAASPTASGSAESLYFSHKDWQLVCDNTRTCRAVGYQAGEDEGPVALKLERKAGPGEPIKASLMIGLDEDGEAKKGRPTELKLTMRIDGKAIGRVTVNRSELVAPLKEEQMAALLKALRRSTEVEWATKDLSWRLSDVGAAAVLLKMDEFQGRVGTVGAALKKGPHDEARVLPALPTPVIVAAAVAKPKPGDDGFVKKHQAALRKSLLAAAKEDGCEELAQGTAEGRRLVASRLSDSKLLVSGLCWRGAYNEGIGYWVVDEVPPHRAVLVTTSGSEYHDGTISAAQKGRGIGDCWSTDGWTWDGQRFVHTESSSTGLCKGIGAGGGWPLPTVVTEVRAAGH
jgi:invasion protein IalB